jgi:hypothetical protein
MTFTCRIFRVSAGRESFQAGDPAGAAGGAEEDEDDGDDQDEAGGRGHQVLIFIYIGSIYFSRVNTMTMHFMFFQQHCNV